MKYFLIVIILGLCGGGYYEYTQLENVQQDQVARLAAAQKQISDLNAQIDQLQSEKKKLEAEKPQLTKNVDVAEGVIADLNAQVKAAQSALDDTKQQLAAVLNKPPPPPPPPTTDLGTITADGKTFLDCQLIRVDTDGIVVKHSTGIVKILSRGLSSDLQGRFGYDLPQLEPTPDAHVLSPPGQKTTIQPAGN
jgi:hypothetical protein